MNDLALNPVTAFGLVIDTGSTVRVTVGTLVGTVVGVTSGTLVGSTVTVVFGVAVTSGLTVGTVPFICLPSKS